MWHQPAWKRDAQKEFEEGHVSGAVRFSISDISDKESAYALMLPPAAQFGEAVGKVSDRTVVYSISTLYVGMTRGGNGARIIKTCALVFIITYSFAVYRCVSSCMI